VIVLKKDYYAIDIIQNEVHHYAIDVMIDSDPEDYLEMKNGRILIFSSNVDLYAYLKDNNITLCQEGTFTTYDINRLECILEDLNKHFDCDEVLGWWNLFNTITHNTDTKYLGDQKKYNDLYNELFGGCNTAVNAYEYHPIFSESDVSRIIKVLNDGLRSIKKILLP
jgi:hypothetical protein